MDGLWPLADRRCDDALPDRSRGVDLAARLLCDLQLHLRFRDLLHPPVAAHGSRWSLDSAAQRRDPQPSDVGRRRPSRPDPASLHRRRLAVVLYWVFVLAVATLLYVLLDGFDLGVGILFGMTTKETQRRAMLSAVAPIWDGNE